MTDNKRPIGVFDSGVGGVSVLLELVSLVPNENIIYYGDSKNAPYGEKNTEEVRSLTFSAAEFLLSKGAKAIVVACNTATGAAVRALREKYPLLPIVGIEPAIKPAVIYGEEVIGKKDGTSKILVLATPVTISQNKFSSLLSDYTSRAEIIPLPCPHLAELIEKGDTDSDEIRDYLEDLLRPYGDVDSVVLGCTHYPFVRRQIEAALPKARIFDGGHGTAKEAVRRIYAAGLQNRCTENGEITFISSKDGETAELYSRFLQMNI
ncbi:MAG: glutamate racemase [Clostridia bacterium]|nr:glutamate racemase [Clostridia bacterium]